MFYPLSFNTWGDEERAAAHRVIDSGYYTMGEEVKAFESEFSSYHNMKYGIMCNSGSSANLLATAALHFKSVNPLGGYRRNVGVPAISWATTYHPLNQYGDHVRFYDIDLGTLNIDTFPIFQDLVESHGEELNAIVAVSILGNPAPLSSLRALADEYGLYLLEDNCESLDAEIDGKKCGTFGHLNTFSFFFSHHISTMESGIVLTDDPELADICRILRAHGWTRDTPDSQIFPKLKGDRFEAYRFILPGYNVRPLEIAAAVGRVQLRKLPEMTRLRRKNLKLFQELFADDPRFIIQKENGKSSAFSFPIILNPSWCEKWKRDQILSLLKSEGIENRIVTGGNFLRHDAIKYYDYSTCGEMKNADIVHDFGFCVGNYPQDLEPQLVKLHKLLDENC